MRTGLRREDLTIIPGEEAVVAVSPLLEQTLLGRVTAAPTQEEGEEEELRMEYEEKDCPAVHGDIDEGGKDVLGLFLILCITSRSRSVWCIFFSFM